MEIIQELVIWQGKVVTIMMSLFDEDEIMEIYIKDREKTAAKEAAARMIQDGVLPLEKIAKYFPNLTENDIKEIEAEVMQMA